MSGAHLKAKMSLDSKGVKAGAKGAGKSVDGFSKQLTKIGPQLAAAFSIGAIAGFTKQVIQYGSQISDLALQTGLSTDELQAFQVAVTNAGGSVENAGKALLKLRDSQSAALSGEKLYADAFQDLGISMEDLAGKSMPQLLEAVAKGHVAFESFSALGDLLGARNAGKLEEALISLADNGFQKSIDKTKEMGLLMSEEDILNLDELADKMERLGIRMKTFWGGILNSILGYGQHISNGIAAIFIGLETAAARVVKNIKNIMKGNFKDVVWTPAGIVKESAGAAWQGITDMNDAQQEEKDASATKREESKQRVTDAQEANRLKKLEALQAKAESAKLSEEEKRVAKEVAEEKRVEALQRKIWEEEGNTDALAASDAKIKAAERSKELSLATSDVERDLIKQSHALEDKKLSTAKQVSDLLKTPPDAEKSETKNLGTVYSGGMGKSIEAAKDFFHIGTGDLDDQLDFWKNKMAASQKRGGVDGSSLGWNASFHSARANDRKDFNQAAMSDVIGRIESLMANPAVPPKELTALEKESKEQTRLLRGIRNAQEISNFE